MSFDKLRNFWRSGSSSSPATQNSNDGSIFDMAENFISSNLPTSFRRGSLPVSTTEQFDDYLAMVGSLRHRSRKKTSTSTSNTSTLKMGLVQHCYKNVESQYFKSDFELQIEQFDGKRSTSMEKQIRMQEQLDEVEVCLFNQITSRFDEILSTLRTLESLSLLVEENQLKLRCIRGGHFKAVEQVTHKQVKMASLLRKKKNMEVLHQKILKIKNYADFVRLSSSLEPSQAYYSSLPTVKNDIIALEQFKATRRAPQMVEEVEQSLRCSFSDKVNGQIYEYIRADKSYKVDFWRKFINLMSIFEDREMENTAILDESTYADGEAVIVLARREDSTEASIMNYINKGWEGGEYSVGKLKQQIEGHLRNYHNAFVLDFRNFCDEACRSHGREVENPSLSNLLKELSPSFCAKAYAYFFDIHKSILLRYFSLTQKCFKLATSKCQEELTIEQKEKLRLMADGFVNTAVFLVRIILEKLIQICESKFIHEGVQLGDFKLLVSVLENAEEFLQKQLLTFLHVEERVSEESFLGDFFCQVKDKFPLKVLEQVKHRKVMDYLNRMHKNALTVELKESLEEEVWNATDIPTEYYDSLHYLITGESLNLRRNRSGIGRNQPSALYDTSVLMDSIIHKEQSFFQEPSSLGSKATSDFRIIRNDIIISGKTYKVTSTVLLMVQILEDYLTLSQNFPLAQQEVAVKMNEIIRHYNSMSCQLIVFAGAVSLQKIKSKNITSRHLGLSSLCLSFIIYLMGCIEKRAPLFESEKLRKALEDHIETIMNKLNKIIVVKSSSAQKDINLEDTPSKGTATIVNNTKILLEIMQDYFDRAALSKIFTKEVLHVYVSAVSALKVASRLEAESLKDDVSFFFGELKGLESITEGFGEYRLQGEDVVRVAFEGL